MEENIKAKDDLMSVLSAEDEKKLKEVHERLAAIPCTETTLIQIEVLFFDMLTILRQYQNAQKAGTLLSELKSIHDHEYKLVQNKQLTVKNRVTAIRKFKNAFRQSLRKAIRQK